MRSKTISTLLLLFISLLVVIFAIPSLQDADRRRASVEYQSSE